MKMIENRLGQPLVVNCGKGRVIHLLARRRATISDEEQETSEIRALISRGALEVRAVRTVSTTQVPNDTTLQQPAEGSSTDKAPKTPTETELKLKKEK